MENYYLSEHWGKITIDTVIKAIKLKIIDRGNIRGRRNKGVKFSKAKTKTRYYQVSQVIVEYQKIMVTYV